MLPSKLEFTNCVSERGSVDGCVISGGVEGGIEVEGGAEVDGGVSEGRHYVVNGGLLQEIVGKGLNRQLIL